MRKYESILIFDPTLGEENLNKEVKKFESLLSANSAANITVNSWGRKEIAYHVGKFKQGYFVQYTFESDNHEAVNLLNAQVRITERVIKSQSHRISDRVRKFKGRAAKPGEVDWNFDDYGDDLDARY